MELLVVIHHPQTPVRPAAEIAAELAAVYDGVYGKPSERHVHALPHASVIHLAWPAQRLHWSSWHEDDAGVLATVGLPISHNEVAEGGPVVTPPILARLIAQEAGVGGVAGHFAAAYVPSDGRVRMVTNHLAMVPLYRASRDRVTVWSNKSAAAATLAGLPAKLNEAAARQFVLLAAPLDHATLWEGVETEDLATCVELTGESVRRFQYRSPRSYFEQPLTAGWASEVTRSVGVVCQLFEQTKLPPAAPAYTDGRLHLSGGQDSRAVAAMLAANGYRPLCVTHGTPNVEVPAAKRIATYLGMPYCQVPAGEPDLDAFRGRVRATLWQSDGLMSLKYLMGLYDLEFIRDERYIPIEGYGGELGRAYYFPHEPQLAQLRAGDFSSLVNKLLGGRAELWGDAAGVESVRAGIEAVIARYRAQGLDGPRVASWYYAHQRARRWAAARRTAGWQWMIDPLTFPAWTYPALSAPPERQIEDRLIRELIEAAVPGTTKLPTVPELAAAARRRRVASNRIVRGALRVWDRVRGPLPEPVQLRGLKKYRRELLERISGGARFIEMIVKPQVVEAWVSGESLSYDRTELFWHALTLAEWCEEFLGKPAAIRPCVAEGRA